MSEDTAFTAKPNTGTTLASRRTGMAFQRTRMGADRTLMATIRTSMSLISFGFTIYQAFSTLEEMQITPVSEQASKVFGGALVGLGTFMLALGILYHLQFMYFLRNERAVMSAEGLIEGVSPYPVSLTLLTAIALLFIGICAVANVIFGASLGLGG